MPPLADALRPLPERAAEVRQKIPESPTLELYDRAVSGVDAARLEALQKAHCDAVNAAGAADPLKYLDLPRWFLMQAKVATLLELHQPTPLRILDIGSGGGQFLHICKQLGHDAVGLDLAKPDIYGELFELFGITRFIGGVFHGEPLPEGVGRFDLITIHAPNFDASVNPEDNWTLEQWAGFLEFLSGEHLTMPGRIFIRLNRIQDADSNSDYLWSLIDLAEQHGADVSHKPPRMIFSLDAPLHFSGVDSEW